VTSAVHVDAYRIQCHRSILIRTSCFLQLGSLEHGIPEGGDQVVNHIKASDLVSAASKHFGQVRQYVSMEEV